VDWSARGVGLRVGGHRGDPENAPENTPAAFEAAVVTGVDYVETDVQRTADGVLVLLHDDDLDRTTNGRGPVAEAAAAEVLALDAGSWFAPEYAGERIVTVDDFLAWVYARRPLGAEIDIKAGGIGAELAERIAASPSRPQLSICSEFADELSEAKHVAPDIPCFLILDDREEDPVERVQACGADGADMPWEWLGVELVARMRSLGLGIMGSTASDERSLRELVLRGADFVDSDRPGTALAVRRSFGPKS
jgi:glycerophosphoryl diester phosphodiesterase